MLFGRFASNRNEARYPTLWDGLVGAWCPSIQNPSGNRLYDLSGRANHGTLTNMDAATDWVRSGGRGALDFDGANDAITVPTFSIANSITMACWLFWRTASNTMFINKQPTNSAFNLFVQSTLILRGGSTSPSVSSSLPPTNAWCHLAATISGTNGAIYINGARTATGAVAAIGNTSGIIEFGRYGDFGGGFWLNGQLDDIRIYNRALSPAEIRLLASQRGIAFTPRSFRRAPMPSGGTVNSFTLSALAGQRGNALSTYFPGTSGLSLNTLAGSDLSAFN